MGSWAVVNIIFIRGGSATVWCGRFFIGMISFCSLPLQIRRTSRYIDELKMVRSIHTKIKRCVILLLIAFAVGLLMLVKWTSGVDQPKDRTDYSVLRRTQFKDIIERDLDILLSSDNDEDASSGKKTVKVKLPANVDGHLISPIVGENQRELGLSQEETSQLTLREILEASRHKDYGGKDISRPKPVQRGSEQLDSKRILYNQNFDLVSASTSHKYITPLLAHDRYIRNCITGDVVGELPASLSSKPIEILDAESVEISESRKASFQEVFDTRAWGHSWDGGANSFNASGKEEGQRHCRSL